MSARLIETWDVLKCHIGIIFRHYLMINRNMRCIEMVKPVRKATKATGLIETWDVLKFRYQTRVYYLNPKINRNMRCIEISLQVCHIAQTPWLIETWDVLKCFSWMFKDCFLHWLIETWDVLKSSPFAFAKRGMLD